MGKRSDYLKRTADKYRTPYTPVLVLLPYLEPGATFVEPTAGDGRLVRHLERHGLRCVDAFDLYPDCLMMRRADALTEPLPPCDYVIANPPWTRNLMHPMIERWRQHAVTWCLFDADWMHTKQAIHLMKYCDLVVSVGRVKWIDGSGDYGKDNAAWYRFQSYPCATEFKHR